MQADEEFEIQIYHHRVRFTSPILGRERYIREKAFLDELTGNWYSPRQLPRPVPDPSQDIYMLDDEQLEAYSKFRKRLAEKP